MGPTDVHDIFSVVSQNFKHFRKIKLRDVIDCHLLLTSWPRQLGPRELVTKSYLASKSCTRVHRILAARTATPIPSHNAHHDSKTLYFKKKKARNGYNFFKCFIFHHQQIVNSWHISKLNRIEI